MKAVAKIAILSVSIAMLVTAMFLLGINVSAQTTWWNTSFAYKNAITIQENFGLTRQAGNNTAIQLWFNGTDGKITNCTTNVRFTNSSENFEYNFTTIYEGISGNNYNCQYQVEGTEDIIKNQNVTYLYIYYDNSINDTSRKYFVSRYDDFSDGYINQGIWTNVTNGGSSREYNNILEINQSGTAVAPILTKELYNASYYFKINFNISTASVNTPQICGILKANATQNTTINSDLDKSFKIRAYYGSSAGQMYIDRQSNTGVVGGGVNIAGTKLNSWYDCNIQKNATHYKLWISNSTDPFLLVNEQNLAGIYAGGEPDRIWLGEIRTDVGVPSTLLQFDNFSISANGLTTTTGEEQHPNQPPQWSNSQTKLGCSNNVSYFNVTWNDNQDINGFDYSAIQLGFPNGTLKNYTMFRFPDNVSHYNLTLNLAGDHNWTVFVNDSFNDWNRTDTLSFSTKCGVGEKTIYINLINQYDDLMEKTSTSGQWKLLHKTTYGKIASYLNMSRLGMPTKVEMFIVYTGPSSSETNKIALTKNATPQDTEDEPTVITIPSSEATLTNNGPYPQTIIKDIVPAELGTSEIYIQPTLNLANFNSGPRINTMQLILYY